MVTHGAWGATWRLPQPGTTASSARCTCRAMGHPKSGSTPTWCRPLAIGAIAQQLKGLRGAAWAIVGCSGSARRSPTLKHPNVALARERARIVFLDHFDTGPRVTCQREDVDALPVEKAEGDCGVA